MKKLISLFLVAVLALGLTMGASAAVATGKIASIDETNFADTFSKMADAGLITLDGVKVATTDALAGLQVKPGSVLRIVLSPALFKDANGASLGAVTDTIPYSLLRTGKITLRASIPETAPVKEAILVSEKNSTVIKVTFDDTPTINRLRFSFSLYLSKNGSRRNATRMIVGGTLGDVATDIYSDDDFVDLSDGRTVRAAETIKKTEFYLGEYCYLTRGLSRNKKVAGTATAELDAKGERLMMKYPYLEYVYTLKTVGLKTEGNIVHFELDDDVVYYVYNSNGTYIGRSNQKLPYWTKYYLCSRKYNSLAVN